MKQVLLIAALFAFMTGCRNSSNSSADPEIAIEPTPTPSLLELVSPSKELGSKKNLKVRVSGVGIGHTVKLFRDQSCSIQVGEGVSTGSTIEITTDDLIQGEHTFYATASVQGVSSPCSLSSVDYFYLECPENYAAVKANPDVGTDKHFCVMVYEAKQIGGAAKSVAAGSPWSNITPLDAATECTDEGGHLISNEEWMTIAREIEKEDRNWSNGVAGYGTLNRGWSALSSTDTFSNTATPIGADENCVYNTGVNTCAATGTHTLRRTHYLSSTDEVIWDFSGSLWEFVDWSLTTTGTNYCPLCTYTGAAFKTIQEYITSCAGLTYENASPFNSNLTTADNIGQIQGNNSATNYAMRGGNWVRGTDAGIYSINLSFGNVGNTTRGFRCVTRPVY